MAAVLASLDVTALLTGWRKRAKSDRQLLAAVIIISLALLADEVRIHMRNVRRKSAVRRAECM
jgi:hypothetical protein